MADALDWPRVDGIDMQLAHLRAGGDLELFRALLSSFMLEFSPQSVPRMQRRSPDDDQAELLLHAKYLHKLCGGAGQLGASKLQELAGGAETAARTGDFARVSALMSRVSFELQRLHANARRLLNATQADPSSASPDPSRALDVAAVRDLVRRLRAQEFAVLEDITELEGPLKRRLGEQRFPRVQRAIQALRFADAAVELEQHLSSETDVER